MNQLDCGQDRTDAEPGSTGSAPGREERMQGRGNSVARRGAVRAAGGGWCGDTAKISLGLLIGPAEIR